MNQINQKVMPKLHDPDFDEEDQAPDESEAAGKSGARAKDRQAETDEGMMSENASVTEAGEEISESASQSADTNAWWRMLDHIPSKVAFAAGLVLSILVLMAAGFLITLPRLL